MIYDKEAALEKARKLLLCLGVDETPGDSEAIAAALLEAQAVVVECIRDSAVRVGEHELMRRDDAVAHLRAMAEELRG